MNFEYLYKQLLDIYGYVNKINTYVATRPICPKCHAPVEIKVSTDDYQLGCSCEHYYLAKVSNITGWDDADQKLYMTLNKNIDLWHETYKLALNWLQDMGLECKHEKQFLILHHAICMNCGYWVR